MLLASYSSCLFPLKEQDAKYQCLLAFPGCLYLTTMEGRCQVSLL